MLGDKKDPSKENELGKDEHIQMDAWSKVRRISILERK